MIIQFAFEINHQNLSTYNNICRFIQEFALIYILGDLGTKML